MPRFKGDGLIGPKSILLTQGAGLHLITYAVWAKVSDPGTDHSVLPSVRSINDIETVVQNGIGIGLGGVFSSDQGSFVVKSAESGGNVWFEIADPGTTTLGDCYNLEVNCSPLPTPWEEATILDSP